MKGLGGIKGRPSRFILAVLSVVLGVAFMSGAVIAHSSVTSTMNGVLGVVTGADVYVQPKGSSVADVLLKSTAGQEYLDSATATQVSVNQAQGALQVYMGAVILMDADDNEVSSGLAPSVALPADPNEVESGRIVEGTLPATINDIALEQKTAERAGLSVGDPATVIANGTTLEVTVSGIVSYDSDLSGAVVVILNGIAARAIYSPSGMIPFVAVKAGDGIEPSDLKAAVASAVTDPNAEVLLGSQARDQALTAINNSLLGFNLVLLIIGVAMMVIGGFLVFTIFASAERARADEIASLKAMGATTSNVLKPVITQGLIVGLIGSAIGMAGGYGVYTVTQLVLDRAGQSTVVSLPWLYLGIAFVLGVVVSIVCARAGAHQAASRTLIDALKGVQARTGFGIVRLILGVVLIVAGVVGIVAGGALWITALGVVAALLGVVFIGPVLVAALSWLFSYVLRLFSPLTARIAAANVSRAPRRPANVAGVFIIALALASATLILSSSASASASSALGKEVKADLVLTPDQAVGIIPDAVVAQVRQVANVQVYTFGQAPMTMDDASDARVMFGPPETFTALSGETVAEGSPDDFATGAAVTKAFADSHDLAIGDTINFTIAKSTPYEVDVTLPVALIINSDLYRDVMVSYSWLIQQVPGHTRSQLMPVTLMFASASDSSQANSIHDPVVAAVDPYKTISVQWKDDFVSAQESQAGGARVWAYALVVLAVVLAVLALVNAARSAGEEQIRQIRVLRAVGASQGQVRTMLVFQSVLMCIAGSLVGIAAGVGLAFVGLNVLSLGFTSLTFPWIWLAGLFVLSILIGLIAPLGPAGRASRAPMAEVAA